MTDRPSVVHGDIDSPRPVHAPQGRLVLSGWSFIAGSAESATVQLRSNAFTLPATSRVARADVAQRFPHEPAAAESGFLIEGHVPPGVHWATLEVAPPNGPWQTLRSLSISAGSRSLAIGIDAPASDAPVRQRVFVEGWALHPDQPLRALALRYGHQEIACTTGRARDDVPLAYPHSTDASTAGFKSKLILSAGVGPARLKATLADGSLAFANTGLVIDVPHDENIGTDIDLHATRLTLPRTTVPDRPTPATERPARPLNILFVLYGSFSSNSALHVAALANELAALGHDCVVAVPHDPETFARFRAARFRGIAFAQIDQARPFANKRGPDIVHAWTTRENVRQLSEKIRARHATKLVVHLEDNEQVLLSEQLQQTPEQLAALSLPELDRLVPADLSHPLRSRQFLAAADGITLITDTLAKFAPREKPSLIVPPAADDRHFGALPPPEEFRRMLRRRPEESLLFYHGNVHASNAAEMRELYAAVAQLNETGYPTLLLRAGRDSVDFLGALAPRCRTHVVDLGEIRQNHLLPPLMALADFFVQPGWDDAFNRYRLPSKLPEFFAIGRPVILPRTNLGARLRHGVDAYVLERADAAGIARAIVELRTDATLRAKLSQGALAVSRDYFNWRRSAESLAKFYATLAA